jgi:hypothetical protein
MLRPPSAWICKKIKNALSPGYQDLMGHLILTTSPWSILTWITLIGIKQQILCCLMTCPPTGPKTFSSGLNVWVQTKNWIAFSAAQKDFVTAQKLNLSSANHLLVWHKKFWPAQNILRSVEGQGIRITVMISSQGLVCNFTFLGRIVRYMHEFEYIISFFSYL